LKQQMEETFNPLNAAVDSLGNYVVLDKNVRPTMKQQMEETFSAFGANDQNTGGYVVVDTTVRDTLKQQMEDTFGAFGASDQGTGTWIPFQGDIIETRRQFYENLPNVGRQAHSAFFGGDAEAGAYIGTGAVTSKQHRGTFATDYVNLSKVSADAEDSSTRWIGQYTKEGKRQLVPYTPEAELASSYQSVAPRLFDSVSVRCNSDLREIDDEFNSMAHGFMYPSQFTEQ